MACLLHGPRALSVSQGTSLTGGQAPLPVWCHLQMAAPTCTVLALPDGPMACPRCWGLLAELALAQSTQAVPASGTMLPCPCAAGVQVSAPTAWKEPPQNIVPCAKVSWGSIQQ